MKRKIEEDASKKCKGSDGKEKKKLEKKAGERGWGGCGSEGHEVWGVLRRIERGEGVEPGIATWEETQRPEERDKTCYYDV